MPHKIKLLPVAVACLILALATHESWVSNLGGHRQHRLASRATWNKKSSTFCLEDVKRAPPSSAVRNTGSPKLFWGKAKGDYSSMPPLANFTSPRRSNILGVLKRGINPTVEFPYEESITAIDHCLMGMALQQARRAWDQGEVPIGAIIVRECTSMDPPNRTRSFQILSLAHNRVETNVDASAHAELLALRKGARHMQNWRFPPNTRLYSTLEPCPMCLASIQAFRIDHIVYGAPDNRLGAIRTHMDLLNVAKHPYHDVKSVTGGVRRKECGEIMVEFFRERRQNKKEAISDGNRPKLLKKLPLKARSGLRLWFTRFLRWPSCDCSEKNPFEIAQLNCCSDRCIRRLHAISTSFHYII
ncbi:hypothetical protein ACHAWF_007036 [Thalassiosira exigua]